MAPPIVIESNLSQSGKHSHALITTNMFLKLSTSRWKNMKTSYQLGCPLLYVHKPELENQSLSSGLLIFPVLTVNVIVHNPEECST